MDVFESWLSRVRTITKTKKRPDEEKKKERKENGQISKLRWLHTRRLQYVPQIIFKLEAVGGCEITLIFLSSWSEQTIFFYSISNLGSWWRLSLCLSVSLPFSPSVTLSTKSPEGCPRMSPSPPWPPMVLVGMWVTFHFPLRGCGCHLAPFLANSLNP